MTETLLIKNSTPKPKKKETIKFILRLFCLIVVSIFLILDLIFIIDNSDAIPPYDIPKATDRLSLYYSYFTTQTNYMVLVYLFALLFEHKIKKNNQPANFFIFLAITVYITVTMLVFWVGLFTNEAERNKYNDAYRISKTIIMHLVMPIVMITSFILTSGYKKHSLKEHHQLYLWFILFYPTFYLVYILVRGELHWIQGDYEGWIYPYPFLNYHTNGVGTLIAAIVVILILTILLQYLYMLINNLRYKKKHHIKNNEPSQKQLEYTHNI